MSVSWSKEQEWGCLREGQKQLFSYSFVSFDVRRSKKVTDYIITSSFVAPTFASLDSTQQVSVVLFVYLFELSGNENNAEEKNDESLQQQKREKKWKNMERKEASKQASKQASKRASEYRKKKPKGHWWRVGLTSSRRRQNAFLKEFQDGFNEANTALTLTKFTIQLSDAQVRRGSSLRLHSSSSSSYDE